MGSALLALVGARASPAQSHVCRSVHGDTIAAGRWAPPLDRIINLRVAQLSLRDALDRIAALAKLRVSYSAELLPLDRAVCISALGEPVGRVLSNVLDGTNVSAVGIGDDQVVLAARRDTAAHTTSPAMAASLGMLDRVVVTGSASATGGPARELSVDVNVIDGHQLARTNTNTIADALDMYVPGMWGWAQSPSSMISSYASIRGASSFGLSYPKIYIDGIEVANPLLISRFNPGTIDHIEVIRGPQGSALYGVDAISGVVNIVTRHDPATNDGYNASLRTTAGVTQSEFSRSVLTQDHSLSLATGSELRSLDLNVSGGSIGAFIPDGASQNLLATASAREVTAHSSLTGTARFFMEQAGTPDSPLVARPIPATPAQSLQSSDGRQSVSQYTIGGSATTSPNEHVTHSFVVGLDGYRLNNVQTNFTPVPSGADSALRAAEGGADRATIRASTVMRLNTTDQSNATMTLAIEHATLRAATVPNVVAPTAAMSQSGNSGEHHNLPPATGATARMDTGTTVSWQNSTGFVAQSNFAVRNTLFLTGGARLEHDSRLAGRDQFETLPMLGAAAVRDFGDVTIKLRTAYGKGIRPPTTLSRAQFWQTRYTATQEPLGPERQSGIEGGVDVYVRHALSFQATRFDQTASGLIQQVLVAGDASGDSHRVQYVAQNVGEISNTGWEFQATGNLSRLTVNGALSFVDSRVDKLAPGYSGDLVAGDRMLQVPARTLSFSALWTEHQWYASLTGARAYDWINYDEVALANAYVNDTRPVRDLVGPRLRQYWVRYNGGLRLRATASRDVRPGFALELSVDNLLNHQIGEPDNATVIPGRSIMSGVRLRF
ncbi:MAG TPA: TonB-dependent receptor [Gemmatimonadaceae bacterium]|nr:TonB-dependent receptor [Gemmatimonadaceae bacterium]